MTPSSTYKQSPSKLNLAFRDRAGATELEEVVGSQPPLPHIRLESLKVLSYLLKGHRVMPAYMQTSVEL